MYSLWLIFSSALVSSNFNFNFYSILFENAAGAAESSIICHALF